MAQLVRHLTLGFGLGHDLGVMGSSPMLGSVLSGNLLGILSLSAPHPALMQILS